MVNTFHRKIGFKVVFFLFLQGIIKSGARGRDLTPYGTHTNSSRTLKIYWHTPTIVATLTLPRFFFFGFIRSYQKRVIHKYTHTYRQTHRQDKC